MKFSWGKKRLKRRLSTALVFIMVSSCVMPAYADGSGITGNLNSNVSFSEDVLSEESLETAPEASWEEEVISEDNAGEGETVIDETAESDEAAQETEEETIEEPSEETDENLGETEAEPGETEAEPGETEAEPEETEAEPGETEAEPEETEESIDETEGSGEAVEETEEDTEESQEPSGETKEEGEKPENESIEETEAPVENAGPFSIEVRNIELMGDYEDGTYTGSGAGYKSTITLKITIADNQITEIQEISQNETLSKWEMAKVLFEEIINANSTDVDAISSATYSSDGIIEAVNDALSKAVTGGSQVFEDGNGSKGDPYIIAENK